MFTAPATIAGTHAGDTAITKSSLSLYHIFVQTSKNDLLDALELLLPVGRAAAGLGSAKVPASSVTGGDPASGVGGSRFCCNAACAARRRLPLKRCGGDVLPAGCRGERGPSIADPVIGAPLHGAACSSSRGFRGCTRTADRFRLACRAPRAGSGFRFGISSISLCAHGRHYKFMRPRTNFPGEENHSSGGFC